MTQSVRNGGRNWLTSQRMRRWRITAMPKWAELWGAPWVEEWERSCMQLANPLVPETWAAGSRCFLAQVHPLDCHPGAGEPLHWANPMAIHGLWLGPGQHVGTQDCSFSGPAVVVGGGGGGQHSSVCICSGSPTKIKASLFHRLLWAAASNDSRPASQHAFVVCLFGLWERLKVEKSQNTQNY